MSLNKIIVQTILTLGSAIYVYSGDHPLRPAPTTPASINTETAHPAPMIFPASPYSTNLTIVNDTELPMVSFKTTYFTSTMSPNTPPLCWPNVSRAFWATMLHHEQKYTGKHYQRLLRRYRELTGNFNEQIMQMVNTADEIRNLIYYNSTQEEILDAQREKIRQELMAQRKETTTTTEAPAKCKCTRNEVMTDDDDEEEETSDKDSFTKIMIPVLLIVILLLLMYIAFLYRKLQFARYKDAQILVQDELADPWATS